MVFSKKSLIAFAVVDLLIIVFFLYYFLRPESPAEIGADAQSMGITVYPQPIVISDFQLTDHRNTVFSQADFKDHWNLVFFGFTTCPDVCPLTLAELKKFYTALQATPLASDTRVFLVSVDPAGDTPQVMADYLASFNADFIGLTGRAATIVRLARELYISHSEIPEQHEGHVVEAGVISHSAHIAVINAEGNYHGVIWAPHEDVRLLNAYQHIRDH
jgi:protein SCO1